MRWAEEGGKVGGVLGSFGRGLEEERGGGHKAEKNDNE